MERDAVCATLGVGVFRARSDGSLEHADPRVAELLDVEALSSLRAAATDHEVAEVRLGDARALVRRDGDALVGLVMLGPSPPPRPEARWDDQVLERAPGGILLAKGGHIVRATPRAATLLGQADERGLIGRPIPVELRGAETEVRLKVGGQARVVEALQLPITHEGEDATLILMRDLTEQGILQAKLTQADRLATIGTLAASVAHEINNPLTYVMHYIERLRRELTELHEQEMSTPRLTKLGAGAETAAEGCRRVRDIVRDLKTFGRMDDGEVAPMDLNRALRSALQMAGHRVRMVARLEIDLAPLPPVRANDGRLCQLFLNLLMNAAQAIRPSDRARARVEVKSWSEDARVYVSVRDTGAGIAEAHLPRLFEPFFSTKPDGVGTGLGLWICRDIVEELGGRLEVQSEVDEGTTMIVMLPRAAGPPIAVSGPAPVMPDSGQVSLGGLRRVLVVDDEPAVLELLAEALGEHTDVVTASDGHEARALLEQDGQFDAILCDLMMPGMGGVELFQWVDRARPPLAARMIFMTGAAYSTEARSFLSRVANERLDKPFRVRDVERALDRVIDAALRVHA